jgi:hypothetical protein
MAASADAVSKPSGTVPVFRSARLETAGKESAKPLALVYIMQTAMKATVPLLPTDEGFYADTDDDTTPPRIGTAR